MRRAVLVVLLGTGIALAGTAYLPQGNGKNAVAAKPLPPIAVRKTQRVLTPGGETATYFDYKTMLKACLDNHTPTIQLPADVVSKLGDNVIHIYIDGDKFAVDDRDMNFGYGSDPKICRFFPKPKHLVDIYDGRYIYYADLITHTGTIQDTVTDTQEGIKRMEKELAPLGKRAVKQYVNNVLLRDTNAYVTNTPSDPIVKEHPIGYMVVAGQPCNVYPDTLWRGQQTPGRYMCIWAPKQHYRVTGLMRSEAINMPLILKGVRAGTAAQLHVVTNTTKFIIGAALPGNAFKPPAGIQWKDYHTGRPINPP